MAEMDVAPNQSLKRTGRCIGGSRKRLYTLKQDQPLPAQLGSLARNEREYSVIRLQAIFLVVSALVYFLTGFSGKYSKKKRLIFALIMYITLFTTVAAMVLISGDKPYE